MNTDRNNEMLSSEAFKTLISKRWKVALVLTVIMLTLYFGYLLLIAFNKEALATIIGADITLAIPVGLGLIISSWLLTGVYVYWANNHYDEAVEDLKKKITK